ncbi:APC family permease [Acidiphilium sp. AL]|uniref:APC family permease n=1 Tax=Acidiphilium iwatense TaxID=768198 RepID=A0ABS9E3Q1_9PROT|nr:MULTISPECIES: APC family permease [Acidiphilium]MCF3948640.1 APC family permease [Acidiphilium iwatense]MCU4161775.1 APC family permease [Acidiphilium sp. AL]
MDARNLATVATHHKLKKGSLGVWQLSGLSFANMAPAYSLFTTLGLVVAGVGFGAPLLFLLAGVATFFHVNTTAEFSRKCPSAGSYTCFISRSFGNHVGITVGIMYLFAWILLIASVFLVVGTWTQFTIKEILGVNTNWLILMVVFVGIGTWLCISGVTLSSRIAISLFVFEVIVLLIGSGFMIFSHVNYISLSPFSFGKLFSNFKGVGLAFPLAIYPFIGSSNAATMAEEAHKPHHSIRVAVFSAITLATILYVFCVYATIIGSKFDNHILTHATYPMISVAKYALGPYVWLFYVAGLTSTLSLVLVAINAAARVLYNLSKEGVLFKNLSNVHETYRTPYAALLLISIGALGVAVVIGLIFGPINAFNWTGTLGTIPLIIIFVIVNLALPVYFIRNHKDHFSVLFHLVFPILGCLIYLVPLYSTVEPGQPTPYNYFGLTTLAVILAGIIYSIYLVNRRFESLNLGLHVALED